MPDAALMLAPPSDAESCAACGIPSTFHVKIVKLRSVEWLTRVDWSTCKGLMPKLQSIFGTDMRDLFDTDLKNANSLLVAHGVGLVGCLSVLKDYTPESRYVGIGFPISIFVFGFVLTCMAIIGVSINRGEMLTWVTHGGQKPKIKSGTSTVLLAAERFRAAKLASWRQNIYDWGRWSR